MATIFDSLKGLITPELISSAASSLGEDKSNVTSAVSSILPGLLGSVLAKGDTPDLGHALTSAGKESDSLLSNIGSLFSGQSDTSTGIGSTIANMLLGDKLKGFATTISSMTGISPDSATKLIGMITPVVGGFLGSKLTSGGLSLSTLMGSLNSEKSSIMSAMPSGLGSSLGLSAVLPEPSGMLDKMETEVKHVAEKVETSIDHTAKEVSSAINNTADKVSSTAEHVVEEIEEKAKGGMGWLKWLIPILALILIFFLWRRCSTENIEKPDMGAIENTAKDGVNAIAGGAETVADEAKDIAENAISELTLPNGFKLSATKGGTEEQMVNMLSSDEYKNATDDQLKEKWINFDKISFKSGSASELTDESRTQLDNIVTIMKQYNTVKFKVGAYTDKVGKPEDNLKLSQERADAIKAMFVKAGVDGKNLQSEGYGDKFAKYAADAPDSERAHDRKISIRLAK